MISLRINKKTVERTLRHSWFQFRNWNKNFNVFIRPQIFPRSILILSNHSRPPKQIFRPFLVNTKRNTQINITRLHLKKFIVTTFKLLYPFRTHKGIPDPIHSLEKQIIKLQICLDSFLFKNGFLMILISLKTEFSIA